MDKLLGYLYSKDPKIHRILFDMNCCGTEDYAIPENLNDYLKEFSYFKVTGNDDIRYTNYNLNNHHLTTIFHYQVLLPQYIKMLGITDNIYDCNIIPFNESGNEVLILVPATSGQFHVEISDSKNTEAFDGDYTVLLNHDNKSKLGCTNSHYHKLFVGAHVNTHIWNKTIDTNRKLLIIGDSHFIPVTPILATYFKETVVIDPRLVDFSMLKDFAPTDALIDFFGFTESPLLQYI